jgi:hypothetical protein
MAQATKAIGHPPQSAAHCAANQILFHRVVAFSFDCIQIHQGLPARKKKEALATREKRTAGTGANPIHSYHAPLSRQISRRWSDVPPSMRPLVRPAYASSTNGEHGRSNTQPHRRDRVRKKYAQSNAWHTGGTIPCVSIRARRAEHGLALRLLPCALPGDTL